MSGGGKGKGRGEHERVVVCSNGMARAMALAGTKVGTNRKLRCVKNIIGLIKSSKSY